MSHGITMNVVMERDQRVVLGEQENLVFQKVKSGHYIIDTPLPFAQYTNEICESITSLYKSVDHLLEGLEDVKNVNQSQIHFTSIKY